MEKGGGMYDAWFVIGVFVFIFLVWIATGGPTHPLSFAGPSLPQPDVLGGGSYLSLPRAPLPLGSSNVSLPGSSGTGGFGGGSYGSGYPSNVGGIPFNSSPFRTSVSLNSYVSNADASKARNEYVQLFVSQNAPGPINLTGWVLESGVTGEAEKIPKGVAVLRTGKVNPTSDIVLYPGDKAIIVSGESPVGVSFKENKCIGYYGSFQQFTPSLPLSCPVAYDELVAFYGTPYIHDPECIDFVDELSRCEVALPPRNSGVGNTCRNFIEDYLNYNGCVDAHKNDSDFEGNTWRIYLDRNASMWRERREIVQLLDGLGKVVDVFSY